MDIRGLALLGKQMRDAQTRYFKTRASGDLDSARSLERRFDAAVEGCLVPTLFAGQDREEGGPDVHG